MRKPLLSIVPQFFLLSNCSFSKEVATLCRSSLMHSVESFELDDNCILSEIVGDDKLHFHQVTRLTYIRISFWNFHQCIHLLNQLGSQLHSFIVTIGDICDYNPYVPSKIGSVSKIFRFNILMNSLL